MKEINEKLMKNFNKLTQENNDNVRDLRDQGDALSIKNDKYDQIAQNMAKQLIGQKLIQISFNKQRDQLAQANRLLMEQGDKLSKVSLEFQINLDKLATSEEDRTKLKLEKDDFFTKLQNSDYRVKTLINDVEFFKNQFTFVKE